MELKVRVKDNKVKHLQANLKRLLLHNTTLYIIYSFRSETVTLHRNFLGIKWEVTRTYIREIDMRSYDRTDNKYKSIEEIPVILDFLRSNILVMRHQFLHCIKYPLMGLGVKFLKD